MYALWRSRIQRNVGNLLKVRHFTKAMELTAPSEAGLLGSKPKKGRPDAWPNASYMVCLTKGRC